MKRPPGRPRLMWDNNIKMDIKELGFRAWIRLIWLRVRNGGGPLWPWK